MATLLISAQSMEVSGRSCIQANRAAISALHGPKVRVLVLREPLTNPQDTSRQGQR